DDARRGAAGAARRRRSPTPPRDPRAVARRARGRALTRPAPGAQRGGAAVHERRAVRVGAAARAGTARRLARRPGPRHPGHALHPTGDGPVAARRDAPPPGARERPARTAAGSPERLPVSNHEPAVAARDGALFPVATWSPESWRHRPAAQQPDWPDAANVEVVENELRALPPLVFAGEARHLTDALGAVSEGR